MWQTFCRHQNTIFNSAQNIKNISNLVKKRKNICQTIKKVSCSLRLLILMSALFLLRYYGSCYRLQHVEKAKKKTQKRTRHVKEDRTCRSAKKKHAEKAKKGERRQKSKEKKRGQNCTLPGKTLSRLRSILYFSYQLLFKHFCILSWGAYSTNFHLFFLWWNIFIIVFAFLALWVISYDQ